MSDNIGLYQEFNDIKTASKFACHLYTDVTTWVTYFNIGQTQ